MVNNLDELVTALLADDREFTGSFTAVDCLREHTSRIIGREIPLASTRDLLAVYNIGYWEDDPIFLVDYPDARSLGRAVEKYLT